MKKKTDSADVDTVTNENRLAFGTVYAVNENVAILVKVGSETDRSLDFMPLNGDEIVLDTEIISFAGKSLKCHLLLFCVKLAGSTILRQIINMSIYKKWALYILILPCCSSVYAQVNVRENAILACMAEALKTSPDSSTSRELRNHCHKQIKTPIDELTIFNKQAESNPFSIEPYKTNYILPYTYSKPRVQPYGDILQGEEFDDVEIKFQISIKFLAYENLFVKGLNAHVAFTSTSWWQAYNSEISAPFRETNYEPEVIFAYNEPWSLLGIPVIQSSLSFNHQSNGRSGSLSRSWNRVIGGVVSSSGNFVWNARAWWRLPEEPKDSPSDIDGDDNLNIEKYMGYGDFGVLWKLPGQNNLDMLLRNNLRSDNKGAVQLGWSFPLFRHLRGYIEYFNGYGESLIYFDQHVQRIGFGVKLTDWL